jgi:hypothetical protein
MVLFLATTAVLAGCDDKPEGASPSGEAAASVKDDELMTPSDFDDEAEKSVTAANYKQELDTLEKELSAP